MQRGSYLQDQHEQEIRLPYAKELYARHAQMVYDERQRLSMEDRYVRYMRKVGEESQRISAPERHIEHVQRPLSK